MKRFATLTIMFVLSIVCLVDYSVAMMPHGVYDFATLGTKRTLEAKHIIVGEVTQVSTVFQRESYPPCSLVTVTIDKDIKQAIENLQNDDDSGGEGETQNSPLRTVTFVQVGGPWGDGGWVKQSGYRLLKVGDYVFLRLMPVKKPFVQNGHSITAGTHRFFTMYSVLKSGDNPYNYTIVEGYKGLDVNVLQMARIVRATLSNPERMRNFERGMGNTRNLADNVRVQALMNEVSGIERASSLPLFDAND